MIGPAAGAQVHLRFTGGSRVIINPSSSKQQELIKSLL